MESTTESGGAGSVNVVALDDSGSKIAAAVGLELIPKECLVPAQQPFHVTWAGKSVIEGSRKGIWGSANLSFQTPQGIRSMRCTKLFLYAVSVGSRANFGYPLWARYRLALVPGMQYLIPLEYLRYTPTT